MSVEFELAMLDKVIEERGWCVGSRGVRIGHNEPRCLLGAMFECVSGVDTCLDGGMLYYCMVEFDNNASVKETFPEISKLFRDYISVYTLNDACSGWKEVKEKLRDRDFHYSPKLMSNSRQR